MSKLDTTVQTSSSEIEPIFNGSAAAAIVGELNTEARCVALLATPYELTPVIDINDNLASLGAFGLVDSCRFNVGGHLKELPDFAVSTISNLPNPEYPENPRVSLWAVRHTGIVSDYFSGLSGQFLQYSLDHGRSLRTILGEKRRKPGNISSTEARLGVLASVLYLTDTSANGTFTKDEVKEMAESFGISDRITNGHLTRLTTWSVVQPVSHSSTDVYRPAIKPDGSDAYDDIKDILRIVASFAIPDAQAIKNGIDRGNQIMKSGKDIARLVHRSYSTSTHTGKSTARRSN